MTVVISDSFVVSPGVDSLNADSPIIGYQTVVTSLNIAATTEDPSFPATNLALVATHLKWKSGQGSPTSEEFLTVTLDTADDIDYLAVAGHNFGTSIAAVSVEGNSQDLGSPNDWFELTSPRLLPDDKPVIFRFTPQPLTGIRLRIQESLSTPAVLPQAAVMYVGRLLYLQRRIYVGHTPMPYGERQQTANHRSVSGAFLGRIVLSETTQTSIEQQNLTPDWYRTYMRPFIIAAKEIPFFWAWRPSTYPDECGYAWLAEDPRTVNQRGNGMMQFSAQIEGIVT